MSDIAEQLRSLRIDLDNERRVRVCIQEAQELERSRLTAAEDAIMEMACDIPELRTAIDKHATIINTHKRLSDNGRQTNKNALNDTQDAIEQVLVSHTASIFRLQQKLDAISQRLQQYPNPGAICLLVKNRPDRDDTNTKAPVDPPETGVDPGTTNAGHGPGPNATEFVKHVRVG